jgi:quinol monooxygenase YgiN
LNFEGRVGPTRRRGACVGESVGDDCLTLLYSSHSVWQSKAAFEAWTKSEEFRAAHARAGNDATGPLYLEHPKFEGFEVRQTVTRKAAVA